MEETKGKCIGIVREQKNKWERRVAITPKEVKVLVEQGIKVIVQPSTIRCFTQKEFEDAGAIMSEDLSEAQLIVGVKEIPLDKLYPGKTHMFFSHTIKAQDYNMPLLDKMLEDKIRLIDYECIKDKGQRLVAFGRYAGIAGVVDFMRGIGEYLLERRYQSFFVNVASTYMYVDLEDIKESITKVGKNIASKGLPPKFAPYVFAVSGAGRVGSGACEILELLPHEYVEADDLDSVPKDDNTKIYITVLKEKDLAEKIEPDGEEFNVQHYYDNPSEYKPKFKKYYDQISFLVNCQYWDAKYPRNIYEKDLCEAIGTKFMGFTDISADYEGSIEVTREFSNIEDPFNLYCRKTQKLKSRISDYEDGDILYHCVDHLPAEMPIESSCTFGENLLPFLPELLKLDSDTKFEDIEGVSDIMKNSIICYNGALTKNYKYIDQLRKLNELQKKEDEEIKEMKRESKGLKRSISFTSLCISGHIFDTKFFNDTLDILESADTSFRVMNLTCGQREDEESSATLQIFSHDILKLNNALEKLHEAAENLPVKITKNYDNAD